MRCTVPTESENCVDVLLQEAPAPRDERKQNWGVSQEL